MPPMWVQRSTSKVFPGNVETMADRPRLAAVLLSALAASTACSTSPPAGAPAAPDTGSPSGDAAEWPIDSSPDTAAMEHANDSGSYGDNSVDAAPDAHP